MDESHSSNVNNQRLQNPPQPDLFRSLMTDSKLVNLCSAIQQYDLAQLHLRHNEGQRRRLKQYLEYNHLRMLELDLSRQRIMNGTASSLVNSENGLIGETQIGGCGGISKGVSVDGTHDSILSVGGRNSTTNSMLSVGGRNSTTLLKPPEMMGAKPNYVVKNTLPLQRPSNHSSHVETEKQPTHTPETQAISATETLMKSLPRGTEPFVIDLQLSPVPSAANIAAVDREYQGDKEYEGDYPKHELMMTAMTTTTNARDTIMNHSSLGTNDIVIHSRRNLTDKEFTNNDVLCERGNFSYNHEGNKRYRAFVKTLQDKYVSSKKDDKILITTMVYEFVTRTMGGRFLGHDEETGIGGWRELSEEEIRRKIGQSLREKNKRYVPAPRKRFVKDFMDNKKGADRLRQEEMRILSQQEANQELSHSSSSTNHQQMIEIINPPQPQLPRQQQFSQHLGMPLAHHQQQQPSKQSGPPSLQQQQVERLSQLLEPPSAQQHQQFSQQFGTPAQQSQLSQPFGPPAQQQQQQHLSTHSGTTSPQQIYLSQQLNPPSARQQQFSEPLGPSSAQQQAFSTAQQQQLSLPSSPSSFQQNQLHLQQPQMPQPRLMAGQPIRSPPPGFSLWQSSAVPPLTYAYNMGKPAGTATMHGLSTGRFPSPPACTVHQPSSQGKLIETTTTTTAPASTAQFQ